MKFVLKGLVAAVVLTVLLQFKVGGETLEAKSDRWIHHSLVGSFLNQTAEGGAKLLREGHKLVSKMTNGLFGQTEAKKESSWGLKTRHQRVESTSARDEQTEAID